MTSHDGSRIDVYDYELGNKPSPGRAAGYAVLDVLTLGLWEIAGTPIEAFQGEKRRITILYDAKDRVRAINQTAPLPENKADAADKRQTVQAESGAHEPATSDQRQGITERNNQNLLRLQIGMRPDEVRAIMGNPEGSEGYSWGSVWLYRTATTGGVYGTADADFTPAVFDEKGSLLGWGRNFLLEHRKMVSR